MAFAGRPFSYPGSDQGYTRPGNDFVFGGTGSGQGVPAQGTSRLAQGLGSIGSMGGQWEPSVIYLLVLIMGEMIFFHILSRVLK